MEENTYTSSSSESDSENCTSKNEEEKIEQKQENTPKKRKRNTDNNERPKKKRRRCYKTIEDGYVLHITGVDKDLVDAMIRVEFEKDEDLHEHYPNAKCEYIDRSLITLALSKEEKKKMQREYRKEYHERKKVDMEKKEPTEEDIKKIEENKEKRRKYNALPQVQERKKLANAAKKEFIDIMKQLQPELYREHMSKRLPKAPRISMKNYTPCVTDV